MLYEYVCVSSNVDTNECAMYYEYGSSRKKHQNYFMPTMQNEMEWYCVPTAQPAPLKPKKKFMLKSPLAAIRNALIKTTRPLRRMNSMVEPEVRAKSWLKRQHSMLERGMQRPFYPNEYPDDYYPQQQQHYYQSHAAYGYQHYEPEESLYSNVCYTQNYNNYPCDDLYANRALIDLERRQADRSGRRVIRRHSTTTTDRLSAGKTSKPLIEPYQDNYYIEPTRRAPNSDILTRRRFKCTEYQTKYDMQQRIEQTKRKMEADFHSPSDSGGKSECEPIYQIRCESNSEPIYVTRNENTYRPHQEPIYECKEESICDNKTDENKKLSPILNSLKKDDHKESVPEKIELKENNEKLNDYDDDAEEEKEEPLEGEKTIINTKAPLVQSEDDYLEEDSLEYNTKTSTSITITETATTTTNTLIVNSQNSINTQPNATSTPYTSLNGLPLAGPVPTTAPAAAYELGIFPTQPRAPKTTRGIFDETGGTLSDPIWHVSLQIPQGAIPAGVRQEIYFTVSDPRLGEAVGGPPLDMENGLC